MPAAGNTGTSNGSGAVVGCDSPPRRILLVAGEASGDQHGAHLIAALNKRNPALAFHGIGGSQMAAAGMVQSMDAGQLAVVGLTEVWAKLPTILRGLRLLTRTMDQWRPDLAILIDYPDFNFRVAARAHQRGIPVLYYVSPQIWAWRTGRVQQIKRLVDHMAVILPFEAPFYRRHGIPVTYVGHPLLDHTTDIRSNTASDLDTAIGVGLLPGSRDGEIARHLPVMLAAARIIAQANPATHFFLPLSPTASKDKIEAMVAPYRGRINLTLSTQGMAAVLNRCRAAVVASGTATLETALYGVPMVIVYKLSALSYHLGRRLIRVDHIGLVNLIARERVAAELIQDEAQPEAIAREVVLLLTDGPHRRRIMTRLKMVRQRLGTAGAAQRVAQLALNMLASQ